MRLRGLAELGPDSVVTMPTRDVLFLTGSRESTRDLVLVAEELRGRGCSCEFGLMWNKPAIEVLLADANMPYFRVFSGESHNLRNSSTTRGSSQSNYRLRHTCLRLLKRSVISILGAIGLLPPVLELHRQLHTRRVAMQLFRQKQYKALVLEGDNAPPTIHFAYAAHRSGIASIVVQSPLLNESGSERLARRKEPRHWTPVGRPLLERIAGLAVATLWPHYVRRVDGLPVLPKRSPYIILTSVALAGLPETMWFQFGGPATWYAVNGCQAVDLLVAEGIPRDKLIVCGQPRIDLILKSLCRASAKSTQTRSSLGLRSDIRLIVVATSPGHQITPDEKVEDIRLLCEQLVSLAEDIHVVIKPHPNYERVEEYERAGMVSDRVQIVPTSWDIVDLVSACDAFVTQRSTSVFFALAAGKPLVTYNFRQIPELDLFANLGLSVRLNKVEDIQPVFRHILARNRAPFLTEERRQVVERHIRLDGRATEAVADLVERAMREGV